MYFVPAALPEKAFSTSEFLKFLAFGATLMQTLLRQRARSIQVERRILER